MKAVRARIEWRGGRVGDVGELGGFGSIECGCWGGEREEFGMNCGFPAWATGRMLSFTEKGNIEERSDLGGRLSSDSVLISGSQ